MAHLIVNGTDPRRITLLTFSRRAAAEMTRRVERIVANVMRERAGVMTDGRERSTPLVRASSASTPRLLASTARLRFMIELKRTVDSEDWASAGASLNRIRQIIAVNLPLGLIVVVIGASGRYWG